MNPIDLFKAQRPKAVDAARDAAAAEYAERYEWFAVSQQMYVTDLPDVAREVGKVAYLYQRAYTAEMSDPEPRANLRQSFCCVPCHVWYIAAAQNARG